MLRLRYGVSRAERFGLARVSNRVAESLAEGAVVRGNYDDDVIDACGTDGIRDMQEHLAAADAVKRLGRAGLHARAQACGEDDGCVVLRTFPFGNQLAESLSKGLKERQLPLRG